jgi:hypothetical protein
MKLLQFSPSLYPVAALSNALLIPAMWHNFGDKISILTNLQTYLTPLTSKILI